MKVLIVGAGSVGTRHARLIHKLSAPEIVIVDPDDQRRAAVMKVVPAREVATLEAALSEHPDAVIICSPTSLHASQCLQALRANCHVLVEKPISHTLETLDLLSQEAVARRRVVLVACNFRFDPALAQMKRWLDSGIIGRPLTCRATYGQDLSQCRPGRDYRRIYASSRDLGGGVLLDCVHEIDYLSWFFGRVESVSAMLGKLGELEIDTEDSANLLLRFSSGTRALVQLDYFRPEYNRSCEIIGTNGILQWSYSPKMLRYLSARSGLWSTWTMDDDSAVDVMYSEQLRHFLSCIAGQSSPAQGIEAGAQTLNVALCAAHASQSRSEVTIASPHLQSEPERQKKAANGNISQSRIVTIVQARMKSVRLPGKVLADVAGKPMLGRVVERANLALLSNGMVVATTEDPVDHLVEQYCHALGVPCFRGSESDVLKRYSQCARRFEADIIVRLTADCPLIDPSLIDEVIHTFLEASVDYASNRRFGSSRPIHSFPDGLDVEVFTLASLETADAEARSDYDREHVTPFIWRQFGRFRLLHIQSPKEFRQRSWTVDYPEDLDFARRIFEHLGDRMFGYKEVLALLESNPEITKSNGHVVPNGDWRYAGRDMMLHDRSGTR